MRLLVTLGRAVRETREMVVDSTATLAQGRVSLDLPPDMVFRRRPHASSEWEELLPRHMGHKLTVRTWAKLLLTRQNPDGIMCMRAGMVEAPPTESFRAAARRGPTAPVQALLTRLSRCYTSSPAA